MCCLCCFWSLELFILHFLYSLSIVLSINRCYFQCWRVLFLLLFSTHIVSLSHVWNVRPYTSSCFLFSGPFTVVLSSFTLRMIPNILNVFIPLMRFLVFSFVSSSFLILLSHSFLIFFFHLHWFDDVRFQYSKLLVNFLFSERSDFSWFAISVHSVIRFFRFSLPAWHIFLCQVPSLYPDWISSLPVFEFSILFRFWQAVWCRPCWLGG